MAFGVAHVPISIHALREEGDKCVYIVLVFAL